MSTNEGQPHVFAEDNSHKILNVIIALIVVAVIAFVLTSTGGDSASEAPSGSQVSSNASLPSVNSSDYFQKEGLYAYHDLKSKGYDVTAKFDNDALTEMNGSAGEMFDELSYDKPEDRLSVDAFVVGSVIQDGDSVKLIILLEPKSS